jgi:hypothetical protein
MPRCYLLAHKVAASYIAMYRCPSGTVGVRNFHYHGHDPSTPYRPMVGGHICVHRHQTVEGAIECTFEKS